MAKARLRISWKWREGGSNDEIGVRCNLKEVTLLRWAIICSLVAIFLHLMSHCAESRNTQTTARLRNRHE